MMTHFFNLESEAKLGFSKIDNEHSRIIDMLNHTTTLLREGKPKQARIYFKDVLSFYVYEHFVNEELFMESFNFPDIEGHKKVHENFRNSFEKTKALVETYDDTSFRQVLSDTFIWTSSHIGRVDKKYIEYYFEQNLAEKKTPETLVN